MPMKRELTEKEREMIRDFILRDKEFEEGTVEFTLSDEERKEMPEWEAKERAEFERWCPITIIDASKAPKTTALKQAYWTAWQARARHAEGQAATRMSHGIDVQAFWDAQAEWSQATFGTDQDRDHIGPLKHLAKEAVEAQVRPSDPFEIADCLFLTFDAARRSGLTLTKLIEVCNEKLAINKARKWDKPTDDNPVEHVRVATQTPLTPAGTDRLLTAIDAYRSGYSCGYADAKNGQSMRDKDAACLFFGVHGVPDIAASPDAKTREAIANVRLDQGECGTRLVPEHAANEYRVFQAEHDDSGSKNKHLIVWRGTETLKAEEVEAALNEPCGCCSTMLEELIEFTKCPDNEDVVEHVKRLLGAAPQLPECSGCTNPYSEGTHCWETKQHPQPFAKGMTAEKFLDDNVGEQLAARTRTVCIAAMEAWHASQTAADAEVRKALAEQRTRCKN